ncbi:MAG: DUF1573 domain-containing protein [Chloroflexi bacterium]|nr:DUF1573 domain-containing protein [Chloroflexota bacterium]
MQIRINLWHVVIALVAIAVAGIAVAKVIPATVPATAGTAQVGPGARGGPRLTVNQPVFDFGSVPYNREVNPSWKLTNTGDAPLEIKNIAVNTQAGC